MMRSFSKAFPLEVFARTVLSERIQLVDMYSAIEVIEVMYCDTPAYNTI
jgi:hypothetical protein